MKKVLFVGHFNDQTKQIQKELSKFVSIQLCSDNVTIAESMMGIYEPDLVLVNVEGFTDGHLEFFQILAEKYVMTPVVIIGSEAAYRRYALYDMSGQVSYVDPQDMAENGVLEALMARVDIDAEVLPDGSIVSKDDRKIVLVVDDSPMMLRSMKQMLEERYQVTLATSGQQALTMIDKRQPDLVVLDYEMPDCDGKETLELIRSKEATKDIPVVFLTGHGDAEHIRSVLDLNPSAYFLKPPKADKILEVLGQLLEICQAVFPERKYSLFLRCKKRRERKSV